MKTSLFILLVLASKASLAFDKVQANFNTKFPRSAADADLCKNTPTSRNCWGEYNIDTNYYTTFPDGGKTVEIWLSVEEAICNQDGYKRSCMTFNGTMPGPPIVADWGDDLIIHVTNRMELNGTAIHWHGVRQLGTVEYDGVPGVTQCPIMPGDTLTYRFKVTQYGTSWYHSHFSLQYAEGLFGPLIFNGPSTADYDIDLGPVVLQDWSHKPIFTSWAARVKWGLTHSLNNLLINGMNTFDCDASADTNCVGGGKKFELVLEPGKKHRLRLINVSIDSAFQFSIDNHKLTVIGNDFVALVPFEVDSILLSSGQRYDVLVEANATPGDYWMRGGWVKTCQGAANDHPDDMTGIVRYDASSTSFPTSISTIPESKTCVDEPTESLVPHLKLDVGKFASTTVEDVNVRLSHTAILQWTINSSSLYLDWNQPTLKKIFDGAKLPLEYNVVEVDKHVEDGDEWAILVIENMGAGAFGNIAHPIHLHGHDFWILAQVTNAKWDTTTRSFNTKNPPRRDVAVLPPNGYLAIAFQLDNPGAWLVHCHIAWHSSQGLAFEFIESRKSISIGQTDRKIFDRTCAAWDDWSPSSPFPQDDSGI